MDANAKLGDTIIKEDPNKMTRNGKLLMDVIKRQNLVITNSLELCKGTITRERIFENKVEQLVIDYILICEELSRHIVEVTIDEDRIYTLSRYLKRKAGKRVIPSDHNILFSKFNIEFERKSKKLRKEFFQFKCESGRKCFLEETNGSNKLSSCFLNDDNFEKSSNLFLKTLKGTFHKCFQKIRIRSGNHKSMGDESVQGRLKLKAEQTKTPEQ